MTTTVSPYFAANRALRSIIRKVRSLYVLTFERLLIVRPRRRVAKKIALVRLDNIGDFVLWLPAADAVRALYPDYRIVLYANQTWADFAAAFKTWDEVIPIDCDRLATRLRYRNKTLRAISSEGYTLAIQPVYSRALLMGDTLIRMTGAPHRIGFRSDLSNMTACEHWITDRWYTHLVPANPSPMTELERNAEFIRGLGIGEYTSQRPRIPKLAELPQALRPPHPCFIIFPGAGWLGRQWPAEHFAALVRALVAATARTAVLCGALADRALCERIANLSGVPCINFAGRTDLVELTELIRAADFLIGNETSAIHLAAAVRTPSVCLLGGGHFGRFVPYPADYADPDTMPEPVNFPMPCYGCNWICTQPHQPGAAVPCIAGISVEAVLASRVISRFTAKSTIPKSEPT